MNHGTRAGDVTAFDIDVIVKLSEIKCSESAQKMTLMDFLQAEVVRLFPGTEHTLGQELEILELAKKGFLVSF